MMNTETKEPNVYVVKGVNFDIEIPVQSHHFHNKLTGEQEDFSFPQFDEMYQAASIAFEVFKGINVHNLFPRIDIGTEDGLQIGVLFQVWKKDTNPAKDGFLFVPVFISAADGGFYKESVEAFNALQAEMKELKKTLPANHPLLKQLEASQPKKKRGRKKKGDNETTE